jgi:hypothetical protein
MNADLPRPEVADPSPRRPRQRWALLTCAGLGLMALLAAGGAVIPGAKADTTDTWNHVYVAFHGSPSCSIDIDAHHRDGSIEHHHDHQVGTCQYAFAWPWSTVADTQVSIHSGTDSFYQDYASAFGPHHDHCVLVKAGGQIEYTGDETQGCNGN